MGPTSGYSGPRSSRRIRLTLRVELYVGKLVVWGPHCHVANIWGTTVQRFFTVDRVGISS
uniref:Glycosyltransferase n=1 Tax=Rhizophora mucronata TaxID=61149 RepID=A0A2P2QWT0_RHIMU